MAYRDGEQSLRCVLCGSLLDEEQGAERFAMLDLCAPCFGGDFGQRLEHRGIRVQQLDLSTRSRGENKTRRDYTLVSGATSHDLELQASFGREDLFTKIGRLFSPELKVGDPLFDDDVFIRTDDPVVLGRLLQSESLQSVIHHAISELADHELPLLVEGSRAQLRSERTPSAKGSDYLRRIVALVAYHLTRDADAHHREQALELEDLTVEPEEREALQELGPYRKGAATAPPPSLFALEQACAHFISGEQLIALELSGDRFDDLGRLARLRQEGGHDRLRHIGLHDLRLGSTDLSPLGQVEGLEGLSLARVDDVTDLTGLAGMSGLKHLDLYGCPVSDITPLAGLTALEELNLNRTGVRDLSPLAGLGQLKQLFVQHTGVRDLAALTHLTALEWLNIRDTDVSDLGPIEGLRNLKRLDVRRSKVPAAHVEWFRGEVPGRQIDPH